MNPESYALAEALKAHLDGAPARGDESLEALSRVLRGSLIESTGTHSEDKYFAVVKRETLAPNSGNIPLEKAREQGLVKTRWLLGWWRDEGEYRAKPTVLSSFLTFFPQCYKYHGVLNVCQ